MTAKDRYPLTVYYDASCSLCRTEMDALKLADSQQRLTLVDCSAEGFADAQVAEQGITQDELMAAMHVRDSAGTWYRGVDSFAQVYAAVGMPGMARFWGNRRFRPALMRSYSWVARNRGWLSKLHLEKPMGWMLRRRARTQARSQARVAAECEESCQQHSMGK